MLEVQSQLQGRGIIHGNRFTSLQHGSCIDHGGSGNEGHKEGSVMHLFLARYAKRVIQKGKPCKKVVVQKVMVQKPKSVRQGIAKGDFCERIVVVR